MIPAAGFRWSCGENFSWPKISLTVVHLIRNSSAVSHAPAMPLSRARIQNFWSGSQNPRGGPKRPLKIDVLPAYVRNLCPIPFLQWVEQGRYQRCVSSGSLEVLDGRKQRDESLRRQKTASEREKDTKAHNRVRSYMRIHAEGRLATRKHLKHCMYPS